jgi:hypothetical protein
MIMNKQIPLKISEIGIKFLNKLRTNRRKSDIDSRDLGNGKLIEIIYKYFKNNPDGYNELLKMEYNKNV